MIKGKNKRILWAAAVAVLFLGGRAAATVDAPDIGLLLEQNRIKAAAEDKIQNDILDPILGKGEAKVFVDVEMEVKVQSEESSRAGMGLAERYKEKAGQNEAGGLQTTFIMPGIPKPKTIAGSQPSDRPGAAQAQQAQQIKNIKEVTYSVNPVFKTLQVTVIHDDSVLKDKNQIDLVRSRIVDAMSQYHLTPDAVFFRPTRFNKFKTDWREDLKRPEVYVPLLFASLLFLFLLFLFGPLRRFFRQYVSAMREKPAAEVNVESRMEAPEEEPEGGAGPIGQEGKLDITTQNKPMEPEEDEDMKKIEPFSFINEENIKRLVYMFLLRKEEPWVIAVVASYLRPDYARQLLTSLPVDLQAKVALEALTVRQVTREQVMAINQQVKENVDFVVGGMEKLLGMLDEVDTSTRSNILNYLKNEKPAVFDKVRKYILLFDDIANFPDRDMQVIVREVKPESMARALHNASPDIVNKFFTNMSAGAMALVKETMEYVKNLSQAQIDEERAKIMDVVKVLEKEGRIAVREKPQEGLDLENLEDSSRQERLAAAARKTPGLSAQPQDPVQAQRYFDAGVSYVNAGQADAALPYFEQALVLNSALWQAHQYLGTILFQAGRVQEALVHYEQALEANHDPQLRQWLESYKAQAGR